MSLAEPGSNPSEKWEPVGRAGESKFPRKSLADRGAWRSCAQEALGEVVTIGPRGDSKTLGRLQAVGEPDGAVLRCLP